MDIKNKNLMSTDFQFSSIKSSRDLLYKVTNPSELQP